MQIKDSAFISYAGTPVKEVWLNNTIVWQASAWTPSNISTVFWYDAADASTITSTGNDITQVLDKSNNGYTLTVVSGQNSPLTNTRTLNGLNVFEWTNNNCLETVFTYNQAATPLNIAMICLVENLDVQEFIWSGTASNAAGKRLALRDASPNWGLIGGSDTGVNFNISGGTATRNQANIVLTQLNNTNSLLRINGTQTGSGVLGTNSFTKLQLGHNEVEVNDLDGYIAEMVAFSDNSNQQIVEGYLAWKWGLQGNLPSNHPYKNNKPTIF